ncbi:MAG: DnaD domain protein [Ruminococcaceae bacterium]|nr:DnaD domain protein [Oscillospiraceae bacterium]
MNTDSIQINAADLRKLLLSLSGDVALLYLYLHSGNDAQGAEKELQLTPDRYSSAAATLRQLGLWPEEKKQIISVDQRPEYSENDVLEAMDQDGGFRMLYGEVQRLMGRTLNTEELKILLSFERYLGLPTEVISVLVSYCKDKARQRGSLRNPSLRAIEKEAYHWAEQGIDTLETAAAFIQNQNTKNSRVEKIKGILQIRGRSLTQAEERYASGWLEMGFDDEAIAIAYERTCLNTGGLNWPYMNKILSRWQAAGLKTGEQVRSGDRKPLPQGASGQLGAAELEAIARVLREE